MDNNTKDLANNSFGTIIQEVQKIINSDGSDFCKAFAISDLVKPEIIKNIDIPEIHLAPDHVDNIPV